MRVLHLGICRFEETLSGILQNDLGWFTLSQRRDCVPPAVGKKVVVEVMTRFRSISHATPTLQQLRQNYVPLRLPFDLHHPYNDFISQSSLRLRTSRRQYLQLVTHLPYKLEHNGRPTTTNLNDPLPTSTTIL